MFGKRNPTEHHISADEQTCPKDKIMSWWKKLYGGAHEMPRTDAPRSAPEQEGDSQQPSERPTPKTRDSTEGGKTVEPNPTRPLQQAMVANVGTLNEQLLQAASDGNADAIQELIAQGADVNARNDKGATPLHRAALKGHLNAVLTLLKANADVHARTTGLRMTPLHFAADVSVDVINALLDHDPSQVDVVDGEGYTPLFFAALKPNNHAVRILLERKASPIAKADDGATPISCVAEECLKADTGHVETIKLLTATPTEELESVLDKAFSRFWMHYSDARRSTLNEILEEVRRKIGKQT
jgi:hypothetical protein